MVRRPLSTRAATGLLPELQQVRTADADAVGQLGDQLAAGLGTRVEKERRVLLMCAVALTASCVAAAGGIAFLGLIAPHLARRLTGPRHQTLIPVSALIGAFLFLLADTLARNVLAPSEVPVGLVISVLGAPYFVYLLMKTK